MELSFYNITVFLGLIGLLMMIFSYLTGMRIWKSKKRMLYHKRIGIIGFIAALIHGCTMMYSFFFS